MNNGIHHTGIVVSYSGGTIYTIEETLVTL
nr:hypothetical protein [Clostridium botulinum]